MTAPKDSVPYMDLTAQYDPLRDEVNAAVQAVFARNAFSGGPFVEELEREFAAYCGVRHAIGVGSGSDAVWLALLAAGVGRGDEVITVPNSFFATAEAISFCGARPVFVDVDPVTMTMDPARLEAAISTRTRAIVPVQLFGQTADMQPILDIAAAHGIPVIEDAAQAHGAEYRGRRAGSLGLAGCFSFYPGKNLGAPGEAGAITTDDDALASRVRMLRDHGQAGKHDHRMIGFNGRMDGIHGAVLRVKLRHLDAWNAARRERASAYQELLSRVPGITLPVEADYARHVFHIYPIRCERRDALMGFLQAEGIGCGVHYPVPIHLQPAYRGLGCRPGDFPVAEAAAATMVSLPIYPELEMAQLRRVCDCISAWQATEAACAGPEQVERVAAHG